MHRFPRLYSCAVAIAAIAACLVAIQPAAADLITFNLDQSNELKDGVVYGTVTVETSTAKGGEVKITYFADPKPYTSTGPNFGFHTVGFNTDLTLKTSQISEPSGWKLTSNANLSMFGKFSWKAATSNSPEQTVVVDITGLGTNATLSHFLLPSVGGESVFFAAHVIDFKLKGSDVSSHWVGDSSTPVGGPPPPTGQGGPPTTPEPSALALSGVGIGALAVTGVLRRRRRVA